MIISTYYDSHAVLLLSHDQENWSTNSTDSIEMQVVEQYEAKYDNTNKPRDPNDLAALLMVIHNQKNPASVVIIVSHSTLTRIKQQYMSTKAIH